MGATADALTAVQTVLTTAGITSIVKESSNATPPTVAHAVLTVNASSLEREDADRYVGDLTVTIDWHYPGALADGETEFLAAMSAWDTIVVALISGLDRTCQSVDPGGNIEQESEGSALPYWYAATATVRMMRQEPAAT